MCAQERTLASGANKKCCRKSTQNQRLQKGKQRRAAPAHATAHRPSSLHSSGAAHRAGPPRAARPPRAASTLKVRAAARARALAAAAAGSAAAPHRGMAAAVGPTSPEPARPPGAPLRP